jgi:D-alanine-D-alanine ligase
LPNNGEIINKVKWTLEYPVFVKPANLGSSIGISIAKNEDELVRAIEIAIRYDNRIIVEKGLENSIDINESVLLKDGEILVSLLEEPVKWETFLSFDDKYINEVSKNGMVGMKRKIPADLSPELTKKIEEYSREIYKTMYCKGVVRIDYLVSYNRNEVFVNEINSIPGSLSFYLWEHSDIKFNTLIDIIIKEAIRINEDKKNQIESFDSNILNKFGGSKSRVNKT